MDKYFTSFPLLAHLGVTHLGEVVYIAFSESSEPSRLVRHWNKVERKYFSEQQPH